MVKYQHLMMEEVICDMLVVLTLIPRHTAVPLTHRVARRTAPQQATVEYTLITLNSPDCKLYPVDKFPVRVQYRLTANPGLTSDRSREWISLESMIAKSKYRAAKIMPKVLMNN